MGGYGKDPWRKKVDRLGGRRSRLRTAVLNAGIIATATVGAGGATWLYETGSIPTVQSIALPAMIDPSCKIKGNISIDTGERIYHVPGQKYYQQTRISPEYGERWFCSEAEARAAGWRKSRR